MQDNPGKTLKRFKWKFILANMVFAVVVLGSVVAVVASLTHAQHVEDVHDALGARVDMAVSRMVKGADHKTEMGNVGAVREGGVPEGNAPQAQGGTGQGATSSSGSTGSDASSSAETGNQGTGGAATAPTSPDGVGQGEQSVGGERTGLSQRAPRASDSDQFVATALYLVDADGTILEESNEAVPIEEEDLADAIDDALQAKREYGMGDVNGYLGDVNLYYKVAQLQDSYIIGFASGRYVDRGLDAFLRTILLACLGAIAAFFLVSVVLSRFVVGPVEQAWKKQQQFVADASHELKTPLTVIMANDSILLSNPEATIESQRQWIESNETEAHAMQELVNDMLYLAKTDAQKNPVELSTVDFSGLVNGQLLQFESVAFEKGVFIDSTVQDGVSIYGDASRLQRLVATLVDNACKYVDENGSIWVDMRSLDKTCVLKVRNTGPVIDAEDQEHVFDRFFRSDKARTRGSGVGLGLSIAKSVVDEHKGTIRVESTEERGTTFTVELPLP